MGQLRLAPGFEQALPPIRRGIILAWPGRTKATVPSDPAPAEAKLLPPAPERGERLTVSVASATDWLRAALIASLAFHALAFVVLQLRFNDDLERAAGAAAAAAQDGAIAVDVIVESVLPAAFAPADTTAANADAVAPTVDRTDDTLPEIDLSKIAALMPQPPEPTPIVLPDAALEMPPLPEPSPVVLPTQREARQFALPEEELAAPVPVETAALPESPPMLEQPPAPPATQKQQAAPPPPQRPAQSRAASPSRAVSAGQTGSAGGGGVADAGGQATISSYQAQVLAHLSRHRIYPPEARSRGTTGVARVQFSLGRDGRVLSAALAGTSGERVLDAAAIAMVERASPFPPFPAGVTQQRLVFGAPIRFDLR